MTALGVRRPDLEPRAHAYVQQVIELASGLLQRGAAYQRDGQVYFGGAGMPAGPAWTATPRCGCRRSTATTPAT